MSTSRTLSKEARDKIVEQALAQRERSRIRSAKAAQSKRDAGMAKVSFWLPKDMVPTFREEVSDILKKFPRGIAAHIEQEAHQEHYGEHHG